MTRRRGMKRTRAPNYTSAAHASEVDQQIICENGTEDVPPTNGVDLPPPPKCRGRGPSQMKPVASTEADRPEVWPVGPCEFDLSKGSCNQLVTTIRKLACINLGGSHRSYNEFQKDDKDKVLLQFLQRYRWQSGADHNECRQVLERIATIRYSDELLARRRDCIAAYGNEFDKWKEMVPHWCKEPQHWYGLCNIWSSMDWQELSSKNKTNRSRTSQLVHHYAGSKSAYKHHQKMVKDLGKDVSYEELYLHIKLPRKKDSQCNDVQGNTNDDSTDAMSHQQNHEGSIVDSMNFPDERSKQVYEDVLRLRADPDNAGKTDEQLFLMASGRPSHGRVYGLGSIVNPTLFKSANNRSKPSQYASVVTSEDNSEMTYTDEQVKEIVEEHARRHAEQMARREKEHLVRHNQKMFYIHKLFELTGNQIPELPQVETTSVPINQGWNDNIEEDYTVLSNHVPPTNVTTENLYVDSFFGSVEFQSNLVL